VKRFITYLFTYENGRKGKNVGFIRTDVKGERLELEVHVQGIGKFSGKGQVFLLVKDGMLWGIPLGGLSVSQGRGAGRFVYDMQDTGEPGYTVNAAAGVAIRFGNLYYAASSWNEEVPEGLAEGTFKEWIRPGAEPMPEPTPKPTPEATPESVPVVPLQETAQPELSQQNAESELVRLATEKLQQAQSVCAGGDVDHPKSGAAQIAEEGTTCEESADERNLSPRRIDISDIRKLPKKNWYLCNNSFLIHGFFNYRYLVLCDLEQNGGKKTYLGVPGIYEKPERMMAMLFGFPDFLPEGSSYTVQEQAEQNGQSNLTISGKPVSADIRAAFGTTTAEAGETGANEPLGSFGYWLCLLDI
jgi:hypothetical protein